MRTKQIMIGGLVLIILMGSYIGFRLWQPSDAYAHFRKEMKVLLGKNSNALVDDFLPRPTMPGKDVTKYDLERLADSDGLVGADGIDKYVEGGNPAQMALTGDQVSNYQTFVTPEDPVIQELAAGKTPEELYAIALKWIWLEDQVLHNMPEKWMVPRDLLTVSPNLPTNPNPGRVTSDCESQAYTLVSALRAAGVPPEYVRVVLGQVNFNGSIGGHAWVELYDDEIGEWFQLEATSGSYYNSAARQLYESEGLPFTYYRKYQFPSIEIWNYFNDEYFWDNKRQQGRIPENWLTGEAKKKQIIDDNVKYKIPDKLKKLREEQDKIIPLPEKKTSGAEVKSAFSSVPFTPEPTPVYAAYQVELLTALEAVADAVTTGSQQPNRKEGAAKVIDGARRILETSNLTVEQEQAANQIIEELQGVLSTGMLSSSEKENLKARITALEQ